MGCPDGTAASYAGTSCTHPGPSVTYEFPPDFFSSEGSVVVRPEEVKIIQDRAGPNTLLISSPKFTLDREGLVIVKMKIKANSNAYSGFLNPPEVSGQAAIEASVTIATDPPTVVKSTPDNTHFYSPVYPYALYDSELVIKIRVGAGGGRATFKSYGTHYGVMTEESLTFMQNAAQSVEPLVHGIH